MPLFCSSGNMAIVFSSEKLSTCFLVNFVSIMNEWMNEWLGNPQSQNELLIVSGNTKWLAKQYQQERLVLVKFLMFQSIVLEESMAEESSLHHGTWLSEGACLPYCVFIYPLFLLNLDSQPNGWSHLHPGQISSLLFLLLWKKYSGKTT